MIAWGQLDRCLLTFFMHCVLAVAGYEIVHGDPQDHVGSQVGTIIQLAIAGPICALVVLLVWYLGRKPFRRIWKDTNNAASVEDGYPMDSLDGTPPAAPHHGAPAGGLAVNGAEPPMPPPISIPLPAVTRGKV